MTDQDRLPEIKAQLAAVDANTRVRSLGPNLTRIYLDWLVGEVDRLRERMGQLKKHLAANTRMLMEQQDRGKVIRGPWRKSG